MKILKIMFGIFSRHLHISIFKIFTFTRFSLFLHSLFLIEFLNTLRLILKYIYMNVHQMPLLKRDEIQVIFND